MAAAGWKRLREIVSDETGQNLVEYALIAGLVALGTIAAMGSFTSNLTSLTATCERQVEAIWP